MAQKETKTTEIMAHIDFKITAWERVEIKEECIDEVIAKIKSGEIQTSNDLIETEYIKEGTFYEIIDGSEETLTPECNNGLWTIEIYEEMPTEKIHYRNA